MKQLVHQQIQKQGEKDSKEQGSAWIVALGLVVLAVASRVLPHPFQWTMLGAVSFFAAVFFTKRSWVMFVPGMSLLISDLFLGFYSGMIWNYAALMFAVAVGYAIAGPHAKKASGFSLWSRRFAAAISGSLLFFFLSNFVVFVQGNMYPHSVSGFWQCYVMALPFFSRQWMADMMGFSALCGVWSAVSMFKTSSVLAEVSEKN